METNLCTLSTASCVIKASFPNPKLESSACGTIIDPPRGLVISHGSILTEYLSEHKSLPAKVRNGKLLLPNDLLGSDFSVLLSDRLVSPELLGNVDKGNGLLTMGASSSSSNAAEMEIHKNTNDSSSNFTQIQCQFLGAFQNKDFHKTLRELMPSSAWTFNDAATDSNVGGVKADDNDHHSQDGKQEFGHDETSASDIAYHLMSYFLIFRFSYLDLGIPRDLIKSKQKILQSFTSLRNRSRRDKSLIGQTAEIIATPFGSLCPAVFFNGYSRGVVSNVSGVNHCWIVTDARCIPGCEGGPLYTKRNLNGTESFLTGIITSPLCWKNNEWVGFSVACSIDSVLKSLTQHQEIIPKRSHKYLTSTRKQNNDNLPDRDAVQTRAMTVLVQCGNTWGTGVIIDRDQGVILTCSHVVKGKNSNSVTVTPSESTRQHRAEVVYRQDPVRTPYDIAVIKCVLAAQHLPKGWSVDVAYACIGEDILLSGHAVFSTDMHLEPSICQGVVSKVLRSKSQPVMVQTTCAVHAGSSGGPLLTPDGRLVGIVVCNTRDASNKTSFPHLNLCVPISTVWPVISDYLANGDKQGLSRLKVQDVELNQLWALGAQASHEPNSNLTSTGYFYHKMWHPFLCVLPNVTKQFAHECLKNTTFYLVGDSNTRAQFDQLSSLTKCKDKIIRRKVKWHAPLRCDIDSIGMSIRLFPHQLPFYGSQKELMTQKKLKSFVILADSIPSTGRHVVLVHYFLHFIPFHLSIAKSRMLDNRAAIARALERNPTYYFIIQGPHAANDHSKLNKHKMNVFLFYMTRSVMSVLGDRVMFLNTLDLTVAIENTDGHPKISGQFMNLYLGHIICGRHV